MQSYDSYDSLQVRLVQVESRLAEAPPESQAWLEQEQQRLKALLEDYPLADDDLFRCERCQQVFDIEDSHRVDHALICTGCHSEA